MADRSSQIPKAILEAKNKFADRSDPYSYFRDKEDSRTQFYLKQEASYAEQFESLHEKLRTTLKEEIKSRMIEDEVKPAYFFAGKWWHEEWRKGDSYCRHFWRKNFKDLPQLLLDENTLAEAHDYFDLGLFEIDERGELLAYAVDTEGDEVYSIHFKSIEEGNYFKDELQETAGSGVWDISSEAFYYIITDDSLREYRVMKHRLGTPQSEDLIIYEEFDPTYSVDVYLSSDRKTLFVSSASKETTEIHYLELSQKSSPLELIQKRSQGIEYWVDSLGDTFYINTNENAPDFHLIKRSKKNSNTLSVLIPPDRNYRITGLEIQYSHLIVFVRQQGLEDIWICDLKGKLLKKLELTGDLRNLSSGENQDHELPYYFFAYESPLQNEIIYKLDLKNLVMEPFYKLPLPKDFEATDFITERVYARSKDGTQVPISLVRNKKISENSNQPLYLYGYGAYGEVVDCGFRTSWISLLNRGVTIAVAHPRGGGYLGEAWYQAGKKKHKKNTFDDFIACAKFLCEKGYTSEGKIVVHGASAGGLLVGNVINQEPDLFKAAILEVPFLDALNTMLDPSLPLTTLEYEEWGNPEEEEAYHLIQSYSPYEQIHSMNYPSILATAGLNDSRVGFWEPLKWVAKLREMKTDLNPLVFKLFEDAGHSGVSGRYEALDEVSLTLAFIINEIGQK